MTNSIKFNLQNFQQIRNNLTETAAKTFQHLIFPHIEYCPTTWSLACPSTLKPIKTLYKKALKVFDRKSSSYLHCHILTNHNLLSFNNIINFKAICVIVCKSVSWLRTSPFDGICQTESKQ